MKIYIEDFLIQNIIINFCLLRLVFLSTKNKTSFFKLFLSAVVGSAFSVCSVIFLHSQTLINLLKLTCSTIMILIAFKVNIKTFIFSFILMFIYTYAFGGAILSISNQTASSNFGIIVLPKLNLYYTTLFLICLTYIFEFIAKHIKSKIILNNYIYEITISCGNKKIKLNAYLDSGNLMKIDGKPAIILDVKTYLKLTDSSIVDFYISSKNKIKTNTVTESKNLTFVNLESVEISAKNKQITLNNQPAIISENKAFAGTNYNALLSPLFLT